MRYLDLTLETPQQNLACDEALLDLCEDDGEREILRCWEPREHFVVLGYSSARAADVDLAACRRQGIPVLRRCSGGGTVLQGPGCLNFSLILQLTRSQPLGTIAGATRFVLTRHKEALEALLGSTVDLQGFSDLALKALKCSGNAQRRKRRCVLMHGTFLLDLDVALMERLLPVPSRQPPYRKNRSHAAFLTNLHLISEAVKAQLQQIWGATRVLAPIPRERIEELVRTRYATEAWNAKF